MPMKEAIRVSKTFLVMSFLLTVIFLLTTQSFAEEKIDINSASVKELQSLEGIGKTLANRIIEYRTANGPFKSTKDIMKVDGIGKLTFEKISGHIIAGTEMSMGQ
jgi:competence protein ComEA